uniref:Putative myosin ii heavy chain n=1 Tax=Ixodes ricinus TaxID=34613 RepID=A0A6B0VFQ3_IXORI
MTLAKPADQDEDECEADGDAHGSSNRDSDIDIIDEDTDNSLHSMNSSALGHTSLMSFSELSVGTSSSFGNLEVLSSDSLEPGTASSDASLPAGLELRPGVRRYRHVPNTRLNWSLTLLAVVVAAAAVGLGVGHYLGWSDRWFLQLKMSQSPRSVLGALHKELEACVQHQDKSPHPLQTRDERVCHEDDEYWANKLERVLLENPSLGQLLDKEASRVSLCEAGYTDCDRKKEDGPPLDLVLNQIRHIMSAELATVGFLLRDQGRTMAHFKKQRERRRVFAEKRAKEEADDLMANLETKVKSLNEENEELRSRLGHDSLREAMLISLERQVQMLQTENSQLKQKMQQVPRHERTLDRTYASRISILRDKVNHLLIENEDLRGVVARLRYSRPLQTTAEDGDPLQELLADDASSLETVEADVDKPVLQTATPDDDGLVLQTSEADDGGSDKTTHADDELEKTIEVDGSPNKAAETEDNVLEKTTDETEEALMVEDSKHWRRLYEQLRESRARDKTGSVWKKLLGTAQTLYDDMETAFDTTLDSLFRYVKDSAELTGDFAPRLQELVTKMREEVTKKRAEFQEYMEQSSQDRDETHGAAVSRTIKLLEGSLKKVFQVGAKFMAKGKKVTEAKADKLFEKLSKVALALGRRWEKVATPGDVQSGGIEAQKKPEEDGLGKRAMDLAEEEEKKEREDWFSSRAKGRERQRNSGEEREDWFSSRAKGRERQRNNGEESAAEADNWYLKRQNWRRDKEAVKTTAKPTKSRADKKTRRNSSRDHRHPSLTSDEDEISYRAR